MRSAFDRVFGTDAWQVPLSWGQVLVTFPNTSTWEVPSTFWHLDHSYAHPRDVIWGVNLFLFVADVEPQGGATMVARGSPALVAHFADAHPELLTKRMKVIRRAFDRSHPWLAELSGDSEPGVDRTERFMATDTAVNGVPVRAVELIGRAGDAVLCHPWALHCGSPNAGEHPRLMRVCRVYRRDQGLEARPY